MTNTPWGGRVNFLFDPKGETVAKALHVSPLMDMTSTWILKGKFTEDEIYLTVRVTHPEEGYIFDAVLALERSQSPHARNERCGFKTLINSVPFLHDLYELCVTQTGLCGLGALATAGDRKSTRLNSSH